MFGSKTIFAVFLILILFPSPIPAEEKGELVLFKEPLFYGQFRREGCDGLYYVKPDKDVPDLRDFRLFFCEGKYSLTLDGPPGKIVTLFGDFDFKKDYGYLIVRKTDDKTVWLYNLESLPPGQWHVVAPYGMYGGSEVFYRAAARFEQNVASVKWGQWWDKLE